MKAPVGILGQLRRCLGNCIAGSSDGLDMERRAKEEESRLPPRFLAGAHGQVTAPFAKRDSV